MTYFHRKTVQTVSRARHSGDLVFTPITANRDLALEEEVVPLVGPWEDYTGSSVGVTSRGQQMFAGAQNKFQGTIAGFNGAKLGNLDITGNNADTTRRRTKLIYVEDGH